MFQTVISGDMSEISAANLGCLILDKRNVSRMHKVSKNNTYFCVSF